MTKLTICMPVYNAEKYLEESIGSVLSQTCDDFKFLVYDDGSADGSLEKILSFKDNRITLIRGGENKGGIYARTQLINAIDTEYCMWIDADDRYCRNNAIEDAVEAIVSGDYDMVNFAKNYEIDSNGVRTENWHRNYADFTYCGDRFFEKFYPTDNNFIFHGKIFKSELMKKSIPHDMLDKRFIADDMFFSAVWFYCTKRYRHVYRDYEPIYEYKNSVGIWGSNVGNVSPERVGDICRTQLCCVLSLYNRLNSIKPMSVRELNLFLVGVNLQMVPKMIKYARNKFGNECADNLVRIWNVAFAKDGVHLLNGVDGFACPEFIKQLEDIMK